jgi:hypothetical protein
MYLLCSPHMLNHGRRWSDSRCCTLLLYPALPPRQAVLKMGPSTTASTTMTVPGPQLGADLFRWA